MPSTDALLAGGVLLAMVVVLAVPILWMTSRSARRHDPTLAEASSAIGPDGRFELELSARGGEVLYFRYEITSDSDFDFDLVVRGEVASEGHARPFAWKTSLNSALAADDVEHVRVTHASARHAGSIELAELPTERCRVTGRVEARPASLLKRGWVYVPSRRGT